MSILTPTSTTAPAAMYRLRDFWRLFTANRKVSYGIIILAFFALVALFGPMILTQNPGTFSADTLAPPSATHWLGTTQTGQDVFLQLIVGTRVSIVLGVVTGIIATAISVIFGLMGGYFGGWIDEVISLFSNVFLVLPALPLAIVLGAFLPYKGPLIIGFVTVVTGWSWGARVLRSQTLSLCNRDFVEAARACGESSLRIIFFEILPNEIALVAAELLSTIIYAILAETGLEYLGLGDVTTTSWGTMFYWAANADALVQGAWWWFLPPGLCIAFLGAGLAFINFGIDEIANPRLRTGSAPKSTATKKSTPAKKEREAATV